MVLRADRAGSVGEPRRKLTARERGGLTGGDDQGQSRRTGWSTHSFQRPLLCPVPVLVPEGNVALCAEPK